MSLLVPVVLGDVVEVLAADDESAVHLGGDNCTREDAAANRDKTSEGALLVCFTQDQIQNVSVLSFQPIVMVAECLTVSPVELQD